MVPEMNRAHYSTDEEEFDLNEGFVKPYSIILRHQSRGKGFNIVGNWIFVNYDCIINTSIT